MAAVQDNDSNMTNIELGLISLWEFLALLMEPPLNYLKIRSEVSPEQQKALKPATKLYHKYSGTLASVASHFVADIAYFGCPMILEQSFGLRQGMETLIFGKAVGAFLSYPIQNYKILRIVGLHQKMWQKGISFWYQGISVAFLGSLSEALVHSALASLFYLVVTPGSPQMYLVCNYMITVSSSLICHPFETIVTRLVVDSELSSPRFNGAIDCVQTTIHEEGPLALWSGLQYKILSYTFGLHECVLGRSYIYKDQFG
eukprot:m.160701 g.160701  ORF g.160701 m.160701 type:complete len:258 (+) comp15172_c0_seq3:43-816(+)